MNANEVREHNIKREEYIKYLEDLLFKRGEMFSPPCFVCGYNGPGYYQPDKHPCAKRHHDIVMEGNDD